VFLVSYFPVAAQEFGSLKINGLPEAEYYNSVQDEYGYMLFATDIGLVRWDGEEAMVYNSNNLLPGNMVFRVEKLKKGVLLYVHGYGLYRYSNGNVFRYKINNIIPELSNEKVSPVPIIIEDSIFLNYHDKVLQLSDDLENISYCKKFYVETPNYPNTGKQKFTIFKYRTKMFYLVHSENITPKPFREFNSFLKYTCKYSNNNFVYLHDLNIIQNFGKRTIDKLGGVESIIRMPITFADIVGGVKFIGMKGESLAFLDSSKLEFKPVYGIKNNVNGISQDRNGSYWISAGNAGVFKLRFKHTFKLVTKKNVSVLKVESGNLLVGTTDGTFGYITKRSVLRKINQSDKRINDLAYCPNGIALSNGYIYNTQQKSLSRFNPYSNSKILLSDQDVLTISGWSTFISSSLSEIDSVTTKIEIRQKNLTSNVNCAVRIDNSKLYYIGTTKGIGILNLKERKYSKLIFGTMIDSSFINCLGPNDMGGTLVCTKKSVSLVDGGKIRNLIKLSQKKEHNITCVLSVGEKILLGTTNGVLIYQYNASTNKWKFKRLVSVPIFPSKYINRMAYLDKHFYIGTSKGLICLSESEFDLLPEFYADFILEKVFKAKKQLISLDELSIMDSEYLRFVYNMSDLEGLNDGIHFEYRIFRRGYSDDQLWIETDNPEVIAANLKHGKYILEVKPLIMGLKTSQRALSISFQVKSPFYRREMFPWVIFSVLFLFVLYFVIIRIKMNKTSMELSKTKISLLKSALNPHMIFNSLSTLQSLFLGGREKQAAEQIGHFTKFLRYNLNNYSLTLVPVKSELNYLGNYLELEKARRLDNLEYQFEYNNSELTDRNLIPSMLLQPIVENCIVHHKTGMNIKVLISVRSIESGVQICILDNGGGIENVDDFKKEGRGLSIIDQIIKHFNKMNPTKIVLIYENGELDQEPGTLVKLTLV